MSAYTVPVIGQDFSTSSLKKHNFTITLIVNNSNDVVNAAWSAGLGVHALIWVSFMSRVQKDKHNPYIHISSDGTTRTFGRRDVTTSSAYYIQILRQSMLLERCSLGPSLCMMMRWTQAHWQRRCLLRNRILQIWGFRSPLAKWHTDSKRYAHFSLYRYF